ncbi:MAG: response regulator [Deltaproteobacteria bacterium]|nr:response regulator [Deltaproteobacteria bacterium]
MKRILVVEDDVHLQQLLKEELHENGYEINTASNGKEALTILNLDNDQKPDLIILDIRMPKMDGLETMGNILKSKHDLPVIIHTAYASYKNDVMAMAADAYIIKSHDLSELKAAVHDLLGE